MNSKWQEALSGLLKSVPAIKFRATFSYPAIAIILVGSLVITTFSLASPSSKYQIELLELASANEAEFDPIKAIETLAVKGRAPKTGYSRSALKIPVCQALDSATT